MITEYELSNMKISTNSFCIVRVVNGISPRGKVAAYVSNASPAQVRNVSTPTALGKIPRSGKMNHVIPVKRRPKDQNGEFSTTPRTPQFDWTM